MNVPKLRPEKTYLVPAVSKVFDILELLGREKTSLSLEQIHQKVKAPKTTIYRLLKTCVHRGYVAQGTDGLYRLSSQPKKMRFGFAAQSSDMPFSEIVTSSLKAAAMRNGVELLDLDNHYDPEIAVRNAERLVQEQVDLVIEFQIEHSVAAIISDKIAVAGIPLVAVDMPHPHATYFGADNYRLGYSAGEALARYAIKHWKSKFAGCWASIWSKPAHSCRIAPPARSTGSVLCSPIWRSSLLYAWIVEDSGTKVTSWFWSF